jgi:hypothetical protein
MFVYKRGRGSLKDLFKKGKKEGDIFKFTLKAIYSFDDESENTQIMKYDARLVDVSKGSFIARVCSH